MNGLYKYAQNIGMLKKDISKIRPYQIKIQMALMLLTTKTVLRIDSHNSDAFISLQHVLLLGVCVHLDWYKYHNTVLETVS
jgi:hypothetical protein